jgi:hypothetical protein
MGFSEIEAFLFADSGAHLVTTFDATDHQIVIGFMPVETRLSSNQTNLIKVIFSDVQRYETWADETEKQDWPLDVIGFDSYPSETLWRFVLNCDTVEWIWESAWPKLANTKADHD